MFWQKCQARGLYQSGALFVTTPTLEKGSCTFANKYAIQQNASSSTSYFPERETFL